MATRPTKAQAKNASRALTGQNAAVMVANADPEGIGAQMMAAGVVAADAPVTKESVADGTSAYALASNDITRLANLYNGYDPGFNPFLTNLVNVISMQIAWFRSFNNPLAVLKRGRLEVGETVEEIVNDLPDVHVFSQTVAEQQVERRELPKVYALYHKVNMKRFYKQTISRDAMQTAFLSWSKLGSLVENIISSMTTAMQTDDKMLMLYQIACAILDGAMTPVTVPAPADDTAKDILKQLRTVSDNMYTDETKLYNSLGIYTNTPKEKQVYIQTNEAKNTLDVDALATVFNIDRAEWLGRQISTMSFANFDWDRMTAIFTDPDTGAVETSFHKFTADEIAKLNTVVGVLFDEMWFADYDVKTESLMRMNEQGLYYNHWLHKWDCYSYSPAANAVVFTSVAPTVTKVTVSPAEATVARGSQIQLAASVTGTGIYSSAVTWSISGATSSGTAISADGKLTVGGAETPAGKITVTATSVFNPAVSGTATITVGN